MKAGKIADSFEQKLQKIPTSRKVDRRTEKKYKQIVKQNPAIKSEVKKPSFETTCSEFRHETS